MSYVCYTKSQGAGLVSAEPTVTLHFDNLTKITKNRLIKAVRDNYNSFSWSSKVTAVINALGSTCPITEHLMPRSIFIAMGRDVREEMVAWLLMSDYKLSEPPSNSYDYYGMRLSYIGTLAADDPQRSQAKQDVRDYVLEQSLPYRLTGYDKAQLAMRRKVMHSIEEGLPLTFTGHGNKRF